MYYVYILYSESSDLFYIGSTENPERRLEQHNSAEGNFFTAKHRLWKMKAVFEAGKTRGEAQQLEYFIKRQKSRSLIEKLINPAFKPTGKLAQLVRVPHVRD